MAELYIIYETSNLESLKTIIIYMVLSNSLKKKRIKIDLYDISVFVFSSECFFGGGGALPSLLAKGYDPEKRSGS